ncbi:hypothetical protein Mapa_002719 [Marchantia paleacea]|nr:hypothetical protein Mapa_002719 [Marchantia paleacea]
MLLRNTSAETEASRGIGLTRYSVKRRRPIQNFDRDVVSFARRERRVNGKDQCTPQKGT